MRWRLLAAGISTPSVPVSPLAAHTSKNLSIFSLMAPTASESLRSTSSAARHSPHYSGISRSRFSVRGARFVFTFPSRVRGSLVGGLCLLIAGTPRTGSTGPEERQHRTGTRTEKGEPSSVNGAFVNNPGYGYALLGLTAIVAVLVGVLTFAVLRIAAAARTARRSLGDGGS